ncbi:MAG: DsbA family protein [Gemmatimonadaceae bacterium]
MKSGGKNGGGDKRYFYVILAAVAITGISALSYVASRSGRVTEVDPSITPIANQGHVIGGDSALVEVVEFADFECPACGNFANLTEPDVRARMVNTGLIRFRFMDFPLDIHPNTRTAHMAAWCAGDQGKFWEMHDLIFQNQDRWATQVTRRPAAFMEALARQAALDMSQYGTCMDTQKFAAQIQANYNEAVTRGIPSTPTFIIGSRQVNGVVSYDELKRYVDEAATAARAAPVRPITPRLDPPGEIPRP